MLTTAQLLRLVISHTGFLLRSCIALILRNQKVLAHSCSVYMHVCVYVCLRWQRAVGGYYCIHLLLFYLLYNFLRRQCVIMFRTLQRQIHPPAQVVRMLGEAWAIRLFSHRMLVVALKFTLESDIKTAKSGTLFLVVQRSTGQILMTAQVVQIKWQDLNNFGFFFKKKILFLMLIFVFYSARKHSWARPRIYQVFKNPHS